MTLVVQIKIKIKSPSSNKRTRVNNKFAGRDQRTHAQVSEYIRAGLNEIKSDAGQNKSAWVWECIHVGLDSYPCGSERYKTRHGSKEQVHAGLKVNPCE